MNKVPWYRNSVHCEKSLQHHPQLLHSILEMHVSLHIPKNDLNIAVIKQASPHDLHQWHFHLLPVTTNCDNWQN
jgi:hypothetical protein